MTGKLSKNFHGVGIGPLSKIYSVKYATKKQSTKKFDLSRLISIQDSAQSK